jgi:hypothetical protein
MQPGQEVVKNQHLDLESETQTQGNKKIKPQARHLELLQVKGRLRGVCLRARAVYRRGQPNGAA